MKPPPDPRQQLADTLKQCLATGRTGKDLALSLTLDNAAFDHDDETLWHYTLQAHKKLLTSSLETMQDKYLRFFETLFNEFTEQVAMRCATAIASQLSTGYNDNDLLSNEQVCNLLQISKVTLYSMVHDGLPQQKPTRGQNVYYRYADIKAFIQQHKPQLFNKIFRK